MTHFGFADDPGAQLDSAIRALERQAAVAKDLIDDGVEPADGAERFAAELEQRLREETRSGDGRGGALQVSSPDQMWMGLHRYWTKTEASRPELPAAGSEAVCLDSNSR